ncbi:IS21 family transposase [Syntrophobacter fumaroxidans]|nr:IS21 family transposase [Syntrophobacter fumaroxidans]
MVKRELWYEVQSRFKLKESKKSIARSLELSVQTVRSVLKQKAAPSYRRGPGKRTLLSPFEDHIHRRLAALGYCSRAIYEELVEQGYTGCYDTVRRFVQPLRKEAQTKATMRFETPPGRQAQVDWGQCWTLISGKRIKVHLFVMTLGYSRRLFAKATWDERLATFLACHEEAFEHFGGAAHELVYDNAKTVVVSRDVEGRNVKWNATFWDFSTYYGFRAWAHRPYRAQTKGKVESGVRYVKRFVRGKAFESMAHLNTLLGRWLATVADLRIHGTTHQRPIDLFEQERTLLLPTGAKPPYQVRERAVRYVARDCMVSFETNRYSVPLRFVGKPVEVQCANDRILIFHEGSLIVSHPCCTGKHQSLVDREHYTGIFYGIELPSVRMLAFDHALPLCSREEVEVRDLAFYERLAQEGGAS